MTLDPQKLLDWPFGEVEQSYTNRDTMLYALGLGLGHDPLDEAMLRFVYEDGLMTLPTMPVVLAGPGFWVKDPKSGVDWVRVLHGEQGIVLHRPIPPAATVVGRTRVKAVIDKGPDRGALLLQERTIRDKASGELLATATSTTFARGDGGCGSAGAVDEAPAVHRLPEREPDQACDLPTLPQAALIYRLSGDYNPLHADPKVARAAGFEAPILHGLCTLGVAGHAILKTQCGYDPAKFRSLRLRFSAPVYPGETIRTEMWRDGDVVSFRARVVERDVVVLNNGKVEVA